jgi:hypothetical protein
MLDTKAPSGGNPQIENSGCDELVRENIAARLERTREAGRTLGDSTSAVVPVAAPI